MPSSCRIFFCRHAESRHNAYGDSTPDCDLSEAGEKQAKRLSGHFNLVLCSPMRRARRTLELSGITYDSVETVHDLREMIYDRSDCLVGEKLRRETEGQLVERCQRVRQRLLKELRDNQSDDYRILMVSHCVFGCTLYEVCQLGDRNIPNARILQFELRQ